MLSSGAYVVMVSSGANVIIWCYHVMLSSGMITHPFFIFPENFTHSIRGRNVLPSSDQDKKSSPGEESNKSQMWHHTGLDPYQRRYSTQKPIHVASHRIGSIPKKI